MVAMVIVSLQRNRNLNQDMYLQNNNLIICIACGHSFFLKPFMQWYLTT